MSSAATAASADKNFSSALNAVNDIALPDGFSSWSSGRKWGYLLAVVLTVSVTAASTAVAGAGLSNDQARVAAVVLTAVGTVCQSSPQCIYTGGRTDRGGISQLENRY